jgi:lipid A 4'-phosphatase
MPKKISIPFELWAGAALLALLTVPFALTDFDLDLARVFYRNGWPLGDLPLWTALYRYGTLPGLLLSALALGVLVLGGTAERWRAWRRPAAVVLLTLALGPGLLVNTLGKGYWGRPRPREVQAFGGSETFHRVTQPGTPGRGKSFPSGHPSVGYLFCALFFVDALRRRRVVWLGAGLAYGTLMGVGRMAQGAHFASDVLWSGGLTYLSAALAHYILLPAPESPVWTGAVPPPDPARRTTRWIVLSASLGALTLFFLLATPFYKEWRAGHLGPHDLTAVRLQLQPGPERVSVETAAQPEALRVEAGLQGFGFPKLKLDGRLRVSDQGTTCTASVDLRLRGWVTERGGEVRFLVRRDLALLLEADGLDADLRIGESSAPARYAGLRISGRDGGVLWRLGPGSRVEGPVQLVTRRGDVRVTLESLADPGAERWELGSDRGTVLLQIAQEQAPERPLDVRLWSTWGDAALTAKIGTACGLQVEWDEGAGRSGLQATGNWKQSGNRVNGPGDAVMPQVKVFLATSNGVVGMQVDEWGVKAAPLPDLDLKDATPAPGLPSRSLPDAPAGAGAGPEPGPAEPEPTEEPSWVERELLPTPEPQAAPSSE